MIVEDGRIVNPDLSVATPGIAFADSHNVVDFIPRRFRGRSMSELFAAARRRCALETSKFADRFFDSRYGTETSALVENAAMSDVTSDNLSRGIRYEPTRALPFRRVLRAARIPTDGVFVDMGCGKGRVCMLAIEHGFARVVGIDYSPRLCELSRKNLEIFKQRTGRRFEADIRVVDAVNYAFAGDETVLYLFNPFDGAILGQVIEPLLASLAQRPREVWIVYHNPVWRDVIDKSGLFDVAGEWSAGGGRFLVYRSRAS
jgi:SAM-dependent methyltransferase